MTAGGVLVGLFLAIGPNGWWLDAQWNCAQLDCADPAFRDLVPVEWLESTPSSLWLVFHRRDAWVMAAYLPPDAEEMRWARAYPEISAAEFDRLLPGLQVPRLFLRENVYRQPGGPGDGRGDAHDDAYQGGLVNLDSLPVDSSEILFNALLDAHLDLAARKGDPRIADLSARAEVAMADVPEEHRGEAFRNAVLDFGSHVLSLASEIARQSRRHPPENLCALLDPPRVLFRSWQRAFGDGQFPGRWQRPAHSSAGLAMPGETVITHQTLSAEDKRWVVEMVLGAHWSGNPAVDFSRFCQP